MHIEVVLAEYAYSSITLAAELATPPPSPIFAIPYQGSS